MMWPEKLPRIDSHLTEEMSPEHATPAMPIQVRGYNCSAANEINPKLAVIHKLNLSFVDLSARQKLSNIYIKLSKL